MKLEVKIINNPHGVNVRELPSASSTRISWLAYNTTVTVVKKEGDWYQLSTGGWITAQTQYVKVIRNLEDNPVTPTPEPPPPPVNPRPEPTPATDPAADAFIAQLNAERKSNGLVFKDIKGLSGDIKESTDIEPVSTKVEQGYSIYEGVVPWDDNYIAKNMDVIRKNIGIEPDVGFADVKHELYVKFNRFKKAHPEIYSGKTFSHVFFTRPDLNLLKGGEEDNALGASGSIWEAKLNDEFDNDPTFYYLFNNERRVLLSLTKHYTWQHDFNVYLSNAAESFEISDEFIDTIEHGETLTGYKMQYGKHNIKSNTAGTFSISYTDDKDANIYKMHKAWIEYISKVFRGEATPKRDYIKKRILDYVCSVYYFILGPDNETILFWTKYFGVFPTNTPSSAYSWAKGANVRMPQFSINYAYAFKEDFNPLSLAEFNMNCRMDLTYVRTYEPELLTTGKTFAGPPFIETFRGDPGFINSGGGRPSNGADQYIYKLRFRKDYKEGR